MSPVELVSQGFFCSFGVLLSVLATIAIIAVIAIPILFATYVLSSKHGNGDSVDSDVRDNSNS